MQAVGKANFPCPNCQRMLTFTWQAAQTFNLPTAVVIVMEHNAALCKNCGKEYMPVYMLGGPGSLGCVKLEEVKPASDLWLPEGVAPPTTPGAA